MKKILALVLAGVFALSLAACGTSDDNTSTTIDDTKSEGVMTYAEYDAADLDTEVTVETYIQNKQTWWDNKATFYTQDTEGGYFIYNMPCSQEEYDALVPGTKIKVTGYKSEWSGEIEITDAAYEIEDGTYLAEAIDVTALVGSDDLIKYQNMLVQFSGMTVEAVSYKNDEPGDDIYVTMSKDGTTVEFCVEAYLSTTQPDSDLYAAVGNLTIGEVIDVQGYLYWYNGANTHITGIIFG